MREQLGKRFRVLMVTYREDVGCPVLFCAAHVRCLALFGVRAGGPRGNGKTLLGSIYSQGVCVGQHNLSTRMQLFWITRHQSFFFFIQLESSAVFRFKDPAP